MTLTLQQAAQAALDVQTACNLSGVLHSLDNIIQNTLWPIAHASNASTDRVNTHPIVTLFLLKACELNGCCTTLEHAYNDAELLCKQLAAGFTLDEARQNVFDAEIARAE